MILDEKQIDNLVELAKVKIDKTEKKSLLKQINNILDYVSQLNSVIISDEVDKFKDPVKNINVWREDIVQSISENERQLILQNAPGREEDLIKTKPVFKDVK